MIAGARAVGWLVLGEWRAFPGRVLLAVVAIAVGVALGFAVHLINGSALESFARAVRGVNGAADLQVRAATPLGFAEALYRDVALANGVADASPVVVLDARLGAGTQRLTLLGLDPIRAAAVTPALVGARARGPDRAAEDLFADDALFLSRAALTAAGARLGDRLVVRANGRGVALRVAGTLPAAEAGRRIGTIDIAAAQWRFGRVGRLDRIDLALADGADEDAVRRALAGRLPPGAALGSPESAAMQGEALSRAYRVNLDMLALVALLTGGFLVYSAQSLSVTRRLRGFALVRTLGAPRGQVVAQVAIEGAVVGAIGSGLGLALGHALARVALERFGADLGAGYFDGPARLRFDAGAAALFLVLGLAAALVGSVVPAIRAANAQPAVALRNPGDLADPRVPPRWRLAAGLLTAGVVAALAPPVGGLPLPGYAAMALLLAGGVAVVPWLARTLLGGAAARGTGALPIDLALRHLRGAPGQAAVALGGIVASTALMIAMAVMVTSFRGAVDDWLGEVLSADLYLRREGAGFDPAAQARLAATPGVARIDFSRQLPVTLQPDRPAMTLVARPIAGAAPLPLIGRISPPPAGTVAVWLSEPAARLLDRTPGDAIALPIRGGARFHVAGVWRDYARQHGAIAIEAAQYRRLTGDAQADEGAVTLRPGAPADAVEARLAARAGGEVEIAAPAMLRAYALRLFDRSFAITYLLEAVAILVGLAGVAATISAQTVARAREFGMLRHVGAGRGQIVAMLGAEGALLGLIGGVAGIALGLAMSQVLIHVVNPQSFNWTMATRLPLGLLGGVTAALIAAAGATAMLAGRRAAAVDAVRAVREDW